MSEENGKSDIATRDAWLGSFVREFDEFTTPSGRKCRIQSLSEKESADIEAKNVDTNKGGMSQRGIATVRARRIVACMVDGNGNRIFQDQDVSKLRQCMSASDANFIDRRINALNRDVEDFEETEKN